MDVPDSSDYWADIQDHLAQNGIPREDILPISAVTGEGVIDLVRRLRTVLDALPAMVSPFPQVDAAHSLLLLLHASDDLMIGFRHPFCAVVRKSQYWTANSAGCRAPVVFICSS